MHCLAVSARITGLVLGDTTIEQNQLQRFRQRIMLQISCDSGVISGDKLHAELYATLVERDICQPYSRSAVQFVVGMLFSKACPTVIDAPFERAPSSLTSPVKTSDPDPLSIKTSLFSSFLSF